MSVMASQNMTPFYGTQGEWLGPFPVSSVYNVLTLPSIPNIFVDPRLGGGLVNVNNPSRIELCNFPYGDESSPQFQGWFILDSSGDYLGNTLGCFTTFANCLSRFGWFCSYGLLQTIFGLAMPGSFSTGNGVWTIYGTMFQGPGTSINIDGAPGNGGNAIIQNHHSSFGIGLYDCDTPIVIGATATLLNESNIYGTGITTCVIDIHQGGSVYDNNTDLVARPTCVAAGSASDIKINGHTSLPAMDPTTYILTTARALTFALIRTSVASGGFGGIACDPRSPVTRIEYMS